MTTLYEEVRATLRESEFKPRKQLGQNFLIHENIIASIVQLLDLTPQDEVVEIVEISPGLRRRRFAVRQGTGRVPNRLRVHGSFEGGTSHMERGGPSFSVTAARRLMWT